MIEEAARAGRVELIERVDRILGPSEDAAEAEFSAEFARLFKRLGWDGYHTYDSRRSRKGYPDWTLWRERVVFVELKSSTGKLEVEQMQTLDALRKAGAECYCFRPKDWPEIEFVLTTHKPGSKP